MTWMGLLYREQLKGSRAKASVGTGLRLELVYPSSTTSTRRRVRTSRPAYAIDATHFVADEERVERVERLISAQIFASGAWSA